MYRLVSVLLVPLVLLAGCAAPGAVRLAGSSMGTTWHVVVVGADSAAAEAMRTEIQNVLDRVESRMSNWRPDSELSRLNASPPGMSAVSAELMAVLRMAEQVWRASDGAFDVTVGPLVGLWGFGPHAARDAPSEEELAAARQRVGMRWLVLHPETLQVERLRAVEIDLSAIAKGYAVDRVAARLTALGLGDYLVEVGGEVRVSGHNPEGNAWRLGIELPDSIERRIARRMALTSGAVATSGDYRNFIITEAGRRSHTIDPRSGAPVTHALASVTMVAESAMRADAWATALDVLGPERGLALARQHGFAALFIIRVGDGFDVRMTPSFEPLLLDE